MDRIVFWRRTEVIFVDYDYYSWEVVNSVEIWGELSQFSMALICIHVYPCDYIWWWVQNKISHTNWLWFCTIIEVLGWDALHFYFQHTWFQSHQQWGWRKRVWICGSRVLWWILLVDICASPGVFLICRMQFFQLVEDQTWPFKYQYRLFRCGKCQWGYIHW